MFNRNREYKYNQSMMNRAITSVVLRIVVAGYIIFIAVNVINGTKKEDSSIPAWAGSLIGYVFIAAAAGFIIYAIRSFIKARENARLDAEDAEKPPVEKPVQQPEMSIAEKVRSTQALLDKNSRNDNDRQDS